MRLTKPRKYYAINNWHGWFAWYPVRIDTKYKRQWVWMEKIARKFYCQLYIAQWIYKEYDGEDEK